MDAKEVTARALQPEISRLQQMHERELADIEITAKSQELAIRQEQGLKVKASLEALRIRASDEHKTALVKISNTLVGEIEDLERSHARLMSQLESDYERDLDAMKSNVDVRVEKERRRGRESLQSAQLATQCRLQELRSQHARDMHTLRDNSFNGSFNGASARRNNTANAPVSQSIQKLNNM